MKLIKNSIRIVVLAAVIIGIFSFMKKETLNSEGFIAKSDIVIENGVMTPAYHGSGAMTRSPSPLAWRPDFPGAPREAH